MICAMRAEVFSLGSLSTGENHDTPSGVPPAPRRLRPRVEHAAADITRRILLQACHDRILFVDHPAVVQRDLFAEDLQQRGLTGAVAPDQTHALVVLRYEFRCCLKAAHR